VISFTAFGIPATQGSARAFLRGGRAVVAHDSKSKLLSWRSVVAAEAAKAFQATLLPAPLDVPLLLRVLFVLPRPASAPKRRVYPDRKPDLDKLLRALKDGMTGVIYTDDARVCRVVAEKVYGAPARAEVEVRLLDFERYIQPGIIAGTDCVE
jgi:crossover junction endodeoxyribonuclease RusA